MTDSLKKLAEEMRAESSGSIRFMDEWAARLDAFRERLVDATDACADPDTDFDKELRAIAGEAEETE